MEGGETRSSILATPLHARASLSQRVPDLKDAYALHSAWAGACRVRGSRPWHYEGGKTCGKNLSKTTTDYGLSGSPPNVVQVVVHLAVVVDQGRIPEETAASHYVDLCA